MCVVEARFADGFSSTKLIAVAQVISACEVRGPFSISHLLSWDCTSSSYFPPPRPPPLLAPRLPSLKIMLLQSKPQWACTKTSHIKYIDLFFWISLVRSTHSSRTTSAPPPAPPPSAARAPVASADAASAAAVAGVVAAAAAAGVAVASTADVL